MKPIIETVQICDSDSALRRAELFWIHSYLTEGTELLNIASNPLIRPVDTYTFDSLSTVEQIQHLYIDKKIDIGTIYDLYKKELSYIKEGLLKLCNVEYFPWQFRKEKKFIVQNINKISILLYIESDGKKILFDKLEEAYKYYKVSDIKTAFRKLIGYKQ
jgi:hypothetical protein